VTLPEEDYPEIAGTVVAELYPSRPRDKSWTPRWEDDIAEVYRITGSDLDELVMEWTRD
jgi:hypothetical protein